MSKKNRFKAGNCTFIELITNGLLLKNMEGKTGEKAETTQKERYSWILCSNRAKQSKKKNTAHHSVKLPRSIV